MALLMTGCLGLLARPAQASSGSISARIRLVYEQDGSIPPCRFTSPELTTAQNAVDAYDLEYFADYIAAIQSALTLRAAGACSPNAAPIGQPASGRTPPAAPLPATLTSPTRSGFPAALLLMAILALVLAVLAALLTLGHSRGPSYAWLDSWRHGRAEARYRAEGMWDTIRDRLTR
ncbi:MAG TPA: hypothetical protein VE983_03855 [Solirubrobacteraceae bacterium]|nr:hypothetical protein [Solirubrobacteraceae bacterium]